MPEVKQTEQSRGVCSKYFYIPFFLLVLTPADFRSRLPGVLASEVLPAGQHLAGLSAMSLGALRWMYVSGDADANGDASIVLEVMFRGA